MNKFSVSSRPWLLLPMEIKVREFEAKVLLACIAAEQGYGVLLGRNGFNTNGNYPAGVYMDKCISVYKEAALTNQVDKLGNRLASLDVEGLVYQTESTWLRNRISAQTFELSSLVLTWGDAQREMVNRTYLIPEKVVSTGSPTADLWHPKMHFLYQELADGLVDRFGDFILMSSNFSTVINANGPDFVTRQFIKNGLVKNDAELSRLKEAMQFYQSVLDEFVMLIPLIAEANPNLAVIVRPHPGDDKEFWFSKKPKWPDNVHVVYEGSVSPWILGSRMIIHNSCSTAVEAFAMEKPAIAFCPHVDERFDQNIPNPLSQIAKTVQDVLNLVGNNLRDDTLGREPEKTELFKYHIRSLEDGTFAGERIIEALDQLDLSHSEFTGSEYGVVTGCRVMLRKLRRRLNDFLGRSEFSHAYRMQKNPGVSLFEVTGLMRKYSENFQRWGDIKVKHIEEDLFCFYRD
jgi:surface carbohydrate biosynthesis protein